MIATDRRLGVDEFMEVNLMKYRHIKSFLVLFMCAGALVAFAAPLHAANCNKKPDHPRCAGDGGDDGGGSSSGFDPTACAGATGAFPSLVFNREVHSRNGRLEATQIWLTDQDASCEVLVFQGEGQSGEAPSFHFDSATGQGTLVWIDSEVKGTNRTDLVMRARISVDQQNTVLDASSGSLPLSPGTIWSMPSGDGSGIGIDVSLSPDGTRIAFPVHEGSIGTTGFAHDDLMVCDTFNCSPSSAFHVEQNSSEEPQHGGTFEVAWGKSSSGADRLLFMYREGAGVFGGHLVAIDEISPGSWTAPAIIVENVVPELDPPRRYLWGPESMAVADDSADCVVLSSRLESDGPERVEVVAVPRDASGARFSPKVLDVNKVSGHQASWINQALTCEAGALWLSEDSNDGTIYNVDVSTENAVATGLIGKKVDSNL